MLSKIFSIFGKQTIPNSTTTTDVIPEPTPTLDDGWKLVSDEVPNEVVLAACESYDCGWVMDTVWWYDKDQCWMTTGSIQSEPAHMDYTHWRELPEPPNIPSKWN